jgi:hypothetical protein
MDERRLVSAVQTQRGRTWFEVLDFGEGVDDDGDGDGNECGGRELKKSSED